MHVLCILELQGIGLTLHVPQIMEPISTCTGANGNPAGPTHTRETSPGYFGRRRRLLFGNFASPMGHGAVVTLTLSLLFMLLLSGCVSIYAPLVKDSSYPVDWPDIAPAGQECEGLVGTYVNEGVVRTGDTKGQRALLTQLLDIPGTANEVSLSVKTRKLDKYGDAHSTLVNGIAAFVSVRHWYAAPSDIRVGRFSVSALADRSQTCTCQS